MATKQAWYLGVRAEALAGVYLTRRDDLVVAKQPEGSGLDFLVTISNSGLYSGRLFGVAVKATTKSSNSANGTATEALDDLRELPFPVCLFLFNVKTDEGFYKWILEPISDSGELRVNTSSELKTLTDSEIDTIVQTINDWYDHRR